MRRLLVVGLLLGMSVGFTGAQKTAQKRTFRVGVSVGLSDASTKALVQSYIKRELRSLGDVEVVDFSVSDWQINISVLKEKSVSGVHQGYCMAVAYTRLYEIPNYILDSMLKSSVSAERRALWFRPVRELVNILSVTGGTGSLKWMCESTVAHFDTETLDSMRNIR